MPNTTRTGSPPPAPPGKPFVGHAVAFASDPFGFVRRSVRTTGDVFRLRLFGRDVSVVADPDHVGTALANPDAFAKLDDFRIAFGDALLAVEGDQWQRQRHAMEEFFEPTRIREHAETMTGVAERRVEGWTTGEEVRLDEEMRAVALANLFEVVFGQSLAADELDELAAAANALNGWFKPTSWVLPHWVPTPARREFRRGSEELREWAASLLDETGPTPDDESLLARLATLRDDPDSGFDEAEVLDQVVGTIFAGHETTALTMTYALHQIGSRPAVADRVAAEIDDVVDGRPTLDDLQELTYLEAVIDETLRLYPPVHAIPRVTTAEFELGEHVIPANEQVLLSVWSIHRDPRFYDDPLAFDPDRWADTAPRDRGYEFVPFGSGPRICIGRHFARLEAKAVLAAVAGRYRLGETDALELSPRMTTQPTGPVTASVEDRK